MNVILKSGRLVLVPQGEEEALELEAWKEGMCRPALEGRG